MLAGWFEITHATISQIWTFVNSKLKCKVVNGLARETVCAAIEKSTALNDVWRERLHHSNSFLALNALRPTTSRNCANFCTSLKRYAPMFLPKYKRLSNLGI